MNEGNEPIIHRNENGEGMTPRELFIGECKEQADAIFSIAMKENWTFKRTMEECFESARLVSEMGFFSSKGYQVQAFDWFTAEKMIKKFLIGR